MASAADTFPKLLLQHAEERGQHPAMREKKHGIWQTSSWQQFANEVAEVAAAFAAQGLQRGAHLVLIGDNRPRLYTALCAAQALGAVAVPLYRDAEAQELAAAIHATGATHAYVEDQEQADKLLAVLSQCPSLRCIVYDNDRGMRHYRDKELISYFTLRMRGREIVSSKPNLLQEEAQRSSGADTAAAFFKAGKETRYTHSALIAQARAAVDAHQFKANDVAMACLPPSWLNQHLGSYAQPLIAGYCVASPESSDTLFADMREIGPTYLLAPPTVLAAMHAQVEERMADAGSIKRGLYRRFMDAGESSAIGNLLIHAPLRDVLGLSRVRVAHISGALDDAQSRFFRTLGLKLHAIKEMA